MSLDFFENVPNLFKIGELRDTTYNKLELKLRKSWKYIVWLITLVRLKVKFSQTKNIKCKINIHTQRFTRNNTRGSGTYRGTPLHSRTRGYWSIFLWNRSRGQNLVHRGLQQRVTKVGQSTFFFNAVSGKTLIGDSAQMIHT